MKEKQIIKLHIISIFVAFIIGNTLENLLKYSIPNKVSIMFCSVNYSVWEVTKPIFWTFTLLILPEYLIYGKKNNRFLWHKTISIFSGLIFYIVMYYTYTGVFGVCLNTINYILFVIAIILCIIINCLFNIFHGLNGGRNIKLPPGKAKGLYSLRAISLTLIILLMAGYSHFTLNPPQIPLFYDYDNNIYGTGVNY